MSVHIKKYRQVAATACAWTLLAGTSHAAGTGAQQLADLPLEQLLDIQISTASKFAQPLTEAPAPVSVITASDIRQYGWRTLAELLASIRGLYVNNDRNYSYLGGRGFLRPGDYNTRFLLLVDGDRNNDAIYDQASLGLDFLLDLDLIERVEYVPGPGSSVYGSNAFFGVINIITKNGRDFGTPSVAADAGSAGERSLRASYGWSRDDVQGKPQLLLSATTFNRDGRDLYFPEFDSPATNHGIAHRLDYEKGDSVFFKGEFGAVTLSAGHVQRTKGIPTASFDQVFNDPRSHTGDTQNDAALSYNAALDESTYAYARLFWGSHYYYGDYAYAAPDALNYDGSSSSWWGGEVNIVSSRFQHHKLLAGMEYQRNYRLHQFSDYIYPPGSPVPPVQDTINAQTISVLDDLRQSVRTGVYLQDQISLSDDLLLNAGLRYDHNSLSGNATSPRLALIYKLNRKTTLKVIAGNAFRSPNAYELYYSVAGAGGQKTNPDLKPEHIQTRELALEYQLSAGRKLLLSAYRNRVSDLISQTLDPSDGLLQFRNLSQAEARGVEAEVERIWKSGARLRASYSWQRATDGVTGAQLVDSPSRLGKLNVNLPLNHGRESLGIEAQHVGPRTTLAQATLGGYWLANVTLFSARWMDRAELSASIYNVFDRRYAVPGSGEHVQDALTQDGRSFRLKLDYRF